MDLREDELLEAIRRVLSGTGPEVIVGPGDDAAVVAPTVGEQVLTTDALVEGTHFDLSSSSARDLGAKAIAVNVSDIAAMAASPRTALCALTLSERIDAAWVMELFGGMREACSEYALWLVGGNLAAGNEVSIVVTVAGEVVPGRAVERSGARVGDRLVVTGALGAAAAGLRIARAVATPDPEQLELVRAHQRPTARVGEGTVLARHGATAMIDISDGVGLDLTRLCTASGVGVLLRIDALPVAPGATLAEALGGGEDYELLATLPSDEAVREAATEVSSGFGVPLTQIGVMMDEGVVAVDADGTRRPLEPAGWEHFA